MGDRRPRGVPPGCGAPRHRRAFLRDLGGLWVLAALPGLGACHSGGRSRRGGIDPNALGALAPPDANGLRLPAGFRSRVVARSGQKPVAASTHLWHGAPDGGAVFPTSDGGWIYVSNSELLPGGGVGALRFASDARLVDAYPILSGTARNCAGGPTPWGTWLSCEEVPDGQVHECDPLGQDPPLLRSSLGRFMHEAAAVDPLTHEVYLTEDRVDGRLYRFVPAGTLGNGRPDLDAGVLQAAEVVGGLPGPVVWHDVPDPQASVLPTRSQVPQSTAFNGGEGMWTNSETLYFTTKGDGRVWSLALRQQRIDLVYEPLPPAQLTGVDNVTLTSAGDVCVAEDGGNMEIVALTAQGAVVPIVQVVGHDFSEVTGPAFDPSETRLYFSSQRGSTGLSADGVTFEVTGPWLG